MEESEEVITNMPSIAAALETFIKSIDGLADTFSPTMSAITFSKDELLEEGVNSIISIIIEFLESKNVNAKELFRENMIQEKLPKDAGKRDEAQKIIINTLTDIINKPDWMKSYAQRLPSILVYWQRLRKKVDKIELSKKVIEQSFVTSLISQYDAFLGKLIQALFLMRPETLNASEKNISLSQLQTFKTIENARDFIIGKETENVMRKSHTDQIDWLEKQYNQELIKHSPWQNLSNLRKDVIYLSTIMD